MSLLASFVNNQNCYAHVFLFQHLVANLSKKDQKLIAGQKNITPIKVLVKDQYNTVYKDKEIELIYKIKREDNIVEISKKEVTSEEGLVYFNLKTPKIPQLINYQIRYEDSHVKPKIAWFRIEYIPDNFILSYNLCRILFLKYFSIF